jgi:hypothetical protein
MLLPEAGREERQLDLPGANPERSRAARVSQPGQAAAAALPARVTLTPEALESGSTRG